MAQVSIVRKVSVFAVVVVVLAATTVSAQAPAPSPDAGAAFSIPALGLHIALRDAMVTNLVRGSTIGPLDILMSHLFYAYDVIVVSDWDQSDKTIISFVCFMFSIWLMVSRLTLITPTYMGWVFLQTRFPIGSNMNRVEGVSVSSNLGIYYMSIFKAPETFIKELESIRASFFWGITEDNKNFAWVKWSF
ncbi:hypothetical protein Tco_1395151 [Tanacetum coccineum]